jgi:hypothetical protein
MKKKPANLYSQETIFKNKSTPSLGILNTEKNKLPICSVNTNNTNNSTSLTSISLYI